MKTNKIAMALMALVVISIMSFGVMAYRGNSEEVGPNYNKEVHEQLETALESGDYETWKSIREDNNLPMRGKIFSIVNEDNFDRFVEMHEANEAGDAETANAIRAELGLGQGMMNRGNSEGKGMQSGKGMQGQGMKGQYQGSNNNGNFVDADNDGNCDNIGLNMGRGRR